MSFKTIINQNKIIPLIKLINAKNLKRSKNLIFFFKYIQEYKFFLNIKKLNFNELKKNINLKIFCYSNIILNFFKFQLTSKIKKFNKNESFLIVSNDLTELLNIILEKSKHNYYFDFLLTSNKFYNFKTINQLIKRIP